MIPRLNFFDLYAYLIPGAVLLTVLALPFGPEMWGGVGFGGVLVALLAAYLAGHVLYLLARFAFPARVRGAEGACLQAPDAILRGELYADRIDANGLQSAVASHLGLDLAHTPDEEFESASQEALQRARAYLGPDRGSYAEQLKGMVHLARGVTAAAFLGAAYLGGWIIGRVWGAAPDTTSMRVLGLFAILATVSLAAHQSAGRREEGAEGLALTRHFGSWVEVYWFLVLGMPVAGLVFGARVAPEGLRAAPVGVLLMATLLTGVVFQQRLQGFAKQFARSVFAEFLVASGPELPRRPATRSNNGGGSKKKATKKKTAKKGTTRKAGR